MDELGYVEGRHYTVERRYAEGEERVGAVTALPLPLLTGQRQRIAELALRNRLPSVFHWREYVESGA